MLKLRYFGPSNKYHYNNKVYNIKTRRIYEYMDGVIMPVGKGYAVTDIKNNETYNYSSYVEMREHWSMDIGKQIKL